MPLFVKICLALLEVVLPVRKLYNRSRERPQLSVMRYCYKSYTEIYMYTLCFLTEMFLYILQVQKSH